VSAERRAGPRRVALVAAHFPPSNLAAVHRSRLWAQHLQEFGWTPTVVTTHPDFYEERLDPDLQALVSPALRVIRTRALPVRPVRLVGDLGIRALHGHYRALCELAARGEVDFVHITVPSHFSAVLGRLLLRRHGIPYGIDYIDPWVHHWPGTEKRFSKAWLSYRLGLALEPWAVRHASLITGVAPLYYEDVLKRNPALRGRVVTAAMPYGAAGEDFDLVERMKRKTFLFDPGDGRFHMIYAGAMLPRAYPVLEALLQAVRHLVETQPDAALRFRLHFVGTGKSPDDPQGHNIRPYIEKHGLGRWVDEHPARIGYVDVLNHLRQASAVLVMGSTEAHYTPSKVFQAVQSRRPVLALLHEKSTAASLLHDMNAATVVSLTEREMPRPPAIAAALAALLGGPAVADGVRWNRLEAYTARESARQLAQALDRACAPAR
jgi:hypothetical protein